MYVNSTFDLSMRLRTSETNVCALENLLENGINSATTLTLQWRVLHFRRSTLSKNFFASAAVSAAAVRTSALSAGTLGQSAS